MEVDILPRMHQLLKRQIYMLDKQYLNVNTKKTYPILYITV